MVLNGIVVMVYMIDILYYIITDDDWGVRNLNYKNCYKQIAQIVAPVL